MATKGSRPAMPKDPGRADQVRSDGLRMAQSGGVSKGSRNTGRDPGVKGGDGLKTAWGDQTSKPSVLTDMSAAKKRVR
jgi:hypothetical protein